jgi:O-antigen/teichoic acid export membrane protein
MIDAQDAHVEGNAATPNSGGERSLVKTILRNSLVVSTGGGFVRLLTFAYSILVVRRLGEQAYGQYATVFSFVGLFAVFFELGTAQYVERAVAQDRSRLPRLLWLLIVVRFALALAGIALLTALSAALGYDSVIVLGVFVFTTTFIFASVQVGFQTIFASHERYDIWTTVNVIGQISTLILGTLVLAQGGGFILLLAVGPIGMLMQIGYMVRTTRQLKLGPIPPRLDPREVPSFLRACLPFGLTSLALTITMNVDTFLLSLMQTSEVVGWYSAAYRLVPTIVSLLGGFLIVITPSLARVYVSDPEAVRSWTRGTLKWLAMFALPAAMGISLLAPQIILLLYGAAFAPSSPVLALIAWDVPLRLFNAFAGNVTAAVGLERPAWRIFMTGAVLGIVLYPPAILAFGMMGAAVVTVLTDGINSFLLMRLLSKHMQAHQALPLLLRAAIAAIVMGIAVWALSQSSPLPVTILAGVGIYGILAGAMGLIDRATVARMANFLRQRLHRRSA